MRKYKNIARGDMFDGNSAVSAGVNCMLVMSDVAASLVTCARRADCADGCGCVEGAASIAKESTMSC